MKNKQKEIIFFNLGGVWDTVVKDNYLQSKGLLNDQSLYLLEKKLGYFSPQKSKKANLLEKQLAKEIEKIITKEAKNISDIADHLKFVPNISSFVKGEFISLYSGDSSHLRDSLVAPFVAFLLQYALKHSRTVITGGQGTDTADISMLPLLDVYSFDTTLPPFIFTAANRSFIEANSDAPQNFANMFRVAQTNISSGAYWIFADYIFRASDFVKISPFESKTIDDFSTFYSPHLLAEKIDEFIKEGDRNVPRQYAMVPPTHIVNKVTTESLFNAMQKVHIVDLSEQNQLEEDINAISNAKYKAVVIVAHAFGHVSNPIRYACVQAAMKGKLVILASRCLIGDLDTRYSVNLLNANSNELRSKSKKIISAYKLNKNVARALAIRAIHANLNEYQTTDLFYRYTISRGLSEQDVVVI